MLFFHFNFKKTQLNSYHQLPVPTVAFFITIRVRLAVKGVAVCYAYLLSTFSQNSELIETTQKVLS